MAYVLGAVLNPRGACMGPRAWSLSVMLTTDSPGLMQIRTVPLTSRLGGAMSAWGRKA